MWNFLSRKPQSRLPRGRRVLKPKTVKPILEQLEDRCVPTTFLVGTGGTGVVDVPTIAQAAAQAHNGDTVQIPAGTYTGPNIIADWTQSNLTIESVGGQAILDNQDQMIPNEKAIFVIDGNHVTVQGITFKNAHDITGAEGDNWAGIRGEGNTLTVQNCKFFDNDDGLVIANDPNAMTDHNYVTVSNSEFGYNGFGDGQSHNMYIGEVSCFTLQYSYSHDAEGGHLVKSRALNTYLLYNDLVDVAVPSDSPDPSPGPPANGPGLGVGSSSEIDIPYGGASNVIGNIIEKDAIASNHNFLTYNLENSLNAPPPLTCTQELYVVNNTFVNNIGTGTLVDANTSEPPTDLLLQNNILAGGGTAANVPYTNTTNLQTTNPGFVSWSQGTDGGNYQLAAGSAAIGAGTNPGTADGFSLTPTNQYVSVANTQARPVATPIRCGCLCLHPQPPGRSGRAYRCCRRRSHQ